MKDLLVSPPAAFALYTVLAGLLMVLGRILAGKGQSSETQSAPYASGEAPPSVAAVPGYRGFFVIALFFAMLHLGVLVIGGNPPSITSALYIGGLLIALLVMISG